MDNLTDVELKAKAFDIMNAMKLAENELSMIYNELNRRNYLPKEEQIMEGALDV